MEVKKYINKRLQESLAANGYATADAIREEITRHLEDIAYGNREANRDLVETKDWSEEIEDLYLRYTQVHDAHSQLRSVTMKERQIQEMIEEVMSQHLNDYHAN